MVPTLIFGLGWVYCCIMAIRLMGENHDIMIEYGNYYMWFVIIGAIFPPIGVPVGYWGLFRAPTRRRIERRIDDAVEKTPTEEIINVIDEIIEEGKATGRWVPESWYTDTWAPMSFQRRIAFIEKVRPSMDDALVDYMTEFHYFSRYYNCQFITALKVVIYKASGSGQFPDVFGLPANVK